MNFTRLKEQTALYLDDPHQTRHLDAELSKLINAGLQDVKRAMEDGNASYFNKSQDFSVTSNTDVFEEALNADFSVVTHVENISNDPPTPMEPERFKERHPVYDKRFLPQGLQTVDLWYVRGNQFGVVAPSTSFTARVFYPYSLPEVTRTDETSLALIPGDYHDLIALNAAKRGYAIEQMRFPISLDEIREEQLTQLRAYVTDRQKAYTSYVNPPYE